MAAKFKMSAVTGGGWLVKGTDTNGVYNQTVLHSDLFDEAQAYALYLEANDELNADARKFFKPLMKAAKKHAKKLQGKQSKFGTITLVEGTEGVEAVESVVVTLDADGVALNAIKQGAFDVLVWVGDDLIVVE